MTMPPWTHSRLEAYETCPRQFFILKVEKSVIEPETEPQLWGKRVHTAFEDRLRDGKPLPKGMEGWEPLAKSLEKIPGDTHCEIQLALDRNFQPAAWDNCWTRGIADLVKVAGKTAAVFDYKTGKRKPSSQLRLYSAKVFALYPEVEVVSTGFIWLKDRKIDKDRFTRGDVPAIWQEYLPKVRKLEAAYEANAWPPRPSGLCRKWCPVGRSKCQFCGQ